MHVGMVRKATERVIEPDGEPYRVVNDMVRVPRLASPRLASPR